MCRMIAAVGPVAMSDLARALVLMAANANIGHDHEFRDQGQRFRHDCGWGAVWLEGSRLVRHRSALSCLDDPSLGDLWERGQLRTTGAAWTSSGMAVLHARRTPERSTITTENAHPFLCEHLGRSWAFCHNGTLRDTSQLRASPAFVSLGTTDSELLFHHVLVGLDPEHIESSLASAMEDVTGYTCLNSFLIQPGRVTVYAKAAPDTSRPDYYTMWRGSGRGISIVSSEPVPLPNVSWDPVHDGECFSLTA